MGPQADVVASLVVRAWSEDESRLPLRFRVTRTLDVRDDEQEVAVVTSVDDLMELVELWANEYCVRHLLD
jgi:hypothetical protein